MSRMPAAGVFESHILGRVTESSRIVFLFAILIFAAALAGIYSRPLGFLATFWPANALLAGCLVRADRTRRLPAVLGAMMGYQAAGYIAGDEAWFALQLTAINVTSAVSFALVFNALEERGEPLARPRAVLNLIGAAIIAAAAAGVAGGPVWVANFSGNYFDAWRTWFSSELMNYLVLLPTLLAFPWPVAGIARRQIVDFLRGQQFLSVLAVAAAMGLSLLSGHPIGIVFPVTALVWCALVLPFPAVCAVVMGFAGITMFAVTLNAYDFGPDGLREDFIAYVHMGVAMIGLGPVLVSASFSERQRQFADLEHAALHDSLTQALNHGAFVELAQKKMLELAKGEQTVAALLIDADYFKRVNDEHGHAAGDLALVALSAAIRTSIRQGDIFGRLGGEEFGVLLLGATVQEGLAVANRLRNQVEKMQTMLPSGDVLKFTVSVGAAAGSAIETTLPDLLLSADEALYDAKRGGRNRVVMRRMQT